MKKMYETLMKSEVFFLFVLICLVISGFASAPEGIVAALFAALAVHMLHARVE